MRRALLVLALAGASLPAPAQPVYRCGPDGRYSQTPCEGGVALPTDARTDKERAAAQELAERERKLAAQLEKERLAREAEGNRRGAAGFHTAPRPAPTASPVKAKTKLKKLRKKASPPPRPPAGGT
jgi:hypothetical protein